MKKQISLSTLIKQVRACEACKSHLPLKPRPLIQVHEKSKLLVIGQAPGLKAHSSGKPWDDASGERLRNWLGLTPEIFYDRELIAIMPVGFCYPGAGARGDLPPRKECLELWHSKLRNQMQNLKLTLLIGTYAQAAYLGSARKSSLTETVRSWREYLPMYFPLPHPSPLNNIWLHKNPWFELEVLPHLKKSIKSIL